jgi:hypothetical protein
MTVRAHCFADFNASVAVKMSACGERFLHLFERSYSAEGNILGAKLIWVGGFAIEPL